MSENVSNCGSLGSSAQGAGMEACDEGGERACVDEGERFVLAVKEAMGVASAVRYGTVRYCTVLYGTVQYGTERNGTERYGTVRYGTLPYGTTRHGTLRRVWYKPCIVSGALAVLDHVKGHAILMAWMPGGATVPCRCLLLHRIRAI